MPTIEGSRVICKEPGRYIGWPTVTRMPDGELIAAFSGDRDAHVCPFGKLQIVRSHDGGMTWSNPETVHDSPLDDRDVGIVALPDGTLIMRWFCTFGPEVVNDAHATDAWRRHFEQLRPEDVAGWTSPEHFATPGSRRFGFWLKRSTDGGRSWSDPIAMASSSPKPPALLADGRLVSIGTSAVDREGKSSRVVVEASADQGRSWQTIATLPMFYSDDSPAYFVEPHVVEAEPGRLVALARFERGERLESRGISPLAMFVSDSADGGRTWSPWRQTPMQGKPPHLLKLRDGRLLASYGRRFEPFGQRACLSADGGRTWDMDREIILRDDAPSADLGYPCSVQLEDDSILTVYYQIDPPDEKPCLMATHWRL